MTAGSDHEPTTESNPVVEQMRDATQSLRDRAWMVAPLTTAAIGDLESRSAFVCAGCGRAVQLRRDTDGAIVLDDVAAYQREHPDCPTAPGAAVSRT